MNYVKLSGPPDAQLRQVEKLLNQIARQVSINPIRVPMPVAPVSIFCTEPPGDGVVLRYLVTGKGMIINPICFVDKMPLSNEGEPLESFNLTVEIQRQGARLFHDLLVENGVFKAEIQFPVETGDRIIVSTKAGPRGLWFSFLYQIAIHRNKAESFAREVIANEGS